MFGVPFFSLMSVLIVTLSIDHLAWGKGILTILEPCLTMRVAVELFRSFNVHTCTLAFQMTDPISFLSLLPLPLPVLGIHNRGFSFPPTLPFSHFTVGSSRCFTHLMFTTVTMSVIQVWLGTSVSHLGSSWGHSPLCPGVLVEVDTDVYPVLTAWPWRSGLRFPSGGLPCNVM